MQTTPMAQLVMQTAQMAQWAMGLATAVLLGTTQKRLGNTVTDHGPVRRCCTRVGRGSYVPEQAVDAGPPPSGPETRMCPRPVKPTPLAEVCTWVATLLRTMGRVARATMRAVRAQMYAWAGA